MASVLYVQAQGSLPQGPTRTVRAPYAYQPRPCCTYRVYRGTSGEEALRQARGEGLTLLPAKTKTGYFGVNLDESRKAKPFGARVRLG